MSTGRLIRANQADSDPYGNVSPHRISELREERAEWARYGRRGQAAVRKLDKLIGELELRLREKGAA